MSYYIPLILSEKQQKEINFVYDVSEKLTNVDLVSASIVNYLMSKKAGKNCHNLTFISCFCVFVGVNDFLGIESSAVL